MKPRDRKILKIAVPVVLVTLLAGIAVPLIITTWVVPPAGAALGKLDVQSNTPFTMRFVSDGQPARVFVDMDCASCSFPLTGSMTLTSNGKRIMSTEIEAGDSHDRAWGGTNRKLENHLLFDAPKQPAGAEIIIEGSLVVGPARSDWSTTPILGAPPPRVTVLRVTVAR